MFPGYPLTNINFKEEACPLQPKLFHKEQRGWYQRYWARNNKSESETLLLIVVPTALVGIEGLKNIIVLILENLFLTRLLQTLQRGHHVFEFSRTGMIQIQGKSQNKALLFDVYDQEQLFLKNVTCTPSVHNTR